LGENLESVTFTMPSHGPRDGEIVIEGVSAADAAAVEGALVAVEAEL